MVSEHWGFFYTCGSYAPGGSLAFFWGVVIFHAVFEGYVHPYATSSKIRETWFYPRVFTTTLINESALARTSQTVFVWSRGFFHRCNLWISVERVIFDNERQTCSVTENRWGTSETILNSWGTLTEIQGALCLWSRGFSFSLTGFFLARERGYL